MTSRCHCLALVSSTTPGEDAAPDRAAPEAVDREEGPSFWPRAGRRVVPSLDKVLYKAGE